ncbi:hypothetical protein DCC81_07820 [Chitinophaga parva]|uniref:Uncharacterized protein n=2 Tax=Chitinophaga parva TaxID=2169414 RepID=A0A2T7BNV0_9BACT|nr:hypothetical protein DCC81_07820 [Chitinophaga parva]
MNCTSGKFIKWAREGYQLDTPIVSYDTSNALDLSVQKCRKVKVFLWGNYEDTVIIVSDRNDDRRIPIYNNNYPYNDMEYTGIEFDVKLERRTGEIAIFLSNAHHYVKIPLDICYPICEIKYQEGIWYINNSKGFKRIESFIKIK